MKTAEEWTLKLHIIAKTGTSPYINMDYTIKQIQLDAMKEGMRRAAELCDPEFYEHNECRQAILTAAEQLTEKEL